MNWQSRRALLLAAEVLSLPFTLLGMWFAQLAPCAFALAIAFWPMALVTSHRIFFGRSANAPPYIVSAVVTILSVGAMVIITITNAPIFPAWAIAGVAFYSVIGIVSAAMELFLGISPERRKRAHERSLRMQEIMRAKYDRKSP